VKILLDECVPRQLDQVVTDDECATPQDRGWAGLTNGELLHRAKENLIFSLLLIKTSGINKTSLAYTSPFFSSQQTICVDSSCDCRDSVGRGLDSAWGI